jgi:hypothetical protein
MRFRIAKPKHSIFLLTFTGACTTPVVALFLTLTIDIWSVLFSLVLISLNFYLFYFFGIRSFVITENGLEYRGLFKRDFRSWEKIERIEVRLDPLQYPIRFAWIYIYDNSGVKYEDDNYFGQPKPFLLVSYRKKITDEIEKYYSGEILGKHFGEVR